MSKVGRLFLELQERALAESEYRMMYHNQNQKKQ